MPPPVLCLSGLDPSGGAGLSADIETCRALDTHALPVATALTVQDSRNAVRAVPVATALLAAQLERLLADVCPAAVKIGLLGSLSQVKLISGCLRRLSVPVVLDPVLRAGGGGWLVSPVLARALCEKLLSQVTMATPNAAEARALAGCKGLDLAAQRLLAFGCANVLITGGDEPGEQVVNRWYRNGVAPRHYASPRLAGGFHGAGCTLAAALAARLAHGDQPAQALAAAQRYTYRALQGAYALGGGRRIPCRRRFGTRP
ncbi:MAG: hydroxymethylpyrimidine/phosphomethylpyrimidine kinase [Gammaproteobacteria bacterium]|nr:hydroxymethylpyrimidine/phosphomethylpyrimidine kinase [Gammaproteobacteria bacterium]